MFWRAVTALLLLMLLVGCQDGTAPVSGPPLQVRLAYTTQIDGALVHLALAKGYFREEGVEVIPTIRSFGRQALEAVLAGDADLATVGETPVMFAALNGEKISVVASIFSSEMNHAIVANKTRGVSRADDLRGKRVAFTPGTTSEFFLRTFLLANNLTESEIVPVPLPPDQMPGAIQSGLVDAISTWTPYQKLAERALGPESSVFYAPNLYTENFLLAGRASYVAQNQDALRRVMRAILKAEEFGSRHPAAAKRLLAASLPIAPDIVGECWNESRFRVSLDQSLLISLEEETRWALRHRLGSGKNMPNYLDFIDSRALTAVKPKVLKVLNDVRP